MRAAQLTKYGDSDVIEFTAEAPKPELKPGEVLIEVYAASINPFDVKLSQGLMQQMIPMAFPATLGGDFAGVVRELGDGVTGFEVGQEVFGQADSVHGNGSFAKFTPVSVNSVALKPTKLDFVAAAATPLTAVSAYEALVDTIHAQSGQKVLIHGGAGGIGSFAIQLAKHLGAHVATTASAEDSDYVRELGADEVIDYKSQQFETMLRDYDAVFDNVGGETYMNSF
jgi:NADPH:quinone reductase-like Zn-dependent oxidoreductase